jgi:uncharacterized glyoxalase superfamily protein PhnB
MDASKIVAMRPFLPSRGFAESSRFYERLGFTLMPLGDKLAHVHLGDFAFLLQDFYVKEFAENLMMHLLVKDLDSWWRHIASLELEKNFAVGAPKPPEMQSWGMRVAYVYDPAGVLWHFAED